MSNPNCFKPTATCAVIVLLLFQHNLCAEDGTLGESPHFVLQWGASGAEPGQFHSPICIAITVKDEVFVADLNNSRVQQFTTDGTFVSEFPLPLIFRRAQQDTQFLIRWQ